MIVVQNPPYMIGNRKLVTPDSRLGNEDSFGSQDMSNLTLRDRTRRDLSLAGLEPRQFPTGSTDIDLPSRPRTSTGDNLQSTPTQILFPNHVTEEQEAYVKGFAQALEEIYRQHGPPASSATKYVDPPAGQVAVDKITDPQFMPPNSGQTWLCNESKSMGFTLSQVDNKPALYPGANTGFYEPPFIPYPPMAQENWQISQTSLNSCPSSSFTNVGSTQMLVSTSNDEFVVGSLPSASFSAGQKRNLTKVISQSLGSLTPRSVDSPCGSDVAVPHSRSLGGEFATLDMEEQEKLRLERKRAKNRLAAQKCQMKKVERIHHLETRVSFLRDKNTSLSAKASSLRRDIDQLKSTITLHVSRGCRILSSSAYNSSDVSSFT